MKVAAILALPIALSCTLSWSADFDRPALDHRKCKISSKWISKSDHHGEIRIAPENGKTYFELTHRGNEGSDPDGTETILLENSFTAWAGPNAVRFSFEGDGNNNGFTVTITNSAGSKVHTTVRDGTYIFQSRDAANLQIIIETVARGKTWGTISNVSICRSP